MEKRKMDTGKILAGCHRPEACWLCGKYNLCRAKKTIMENLGESGYALVKEHFEKRHDGAPGGLIELAYSIMAFGRGKCPLCGFEVEIIAA